MIYFAHSVKDYNTDFEKMVMEKLSEVDTVENPNQLHHQKAYEKKRMAYFVDDVIPKCDKLAYLPLEGNSRVGIGVFKEIVTALRLGIIVYRIDRETLEISPITEMKDTVLSYEDTVRYINGELA